MKKINKVNKTVVQQQRYKHYDEGGDANSRKSAKKEFEKY
jgi:hypothetical protein